MRKLLLALVLLLPLAVSGAESQRVALLTSVTGTGAGSAVSMGRTQLSGGVGVVENTPYRTFQAHGTVSTSTGSATILVQVNNGNSTAWITACTLTLTLATSVTTDGCAMAAGWPLVRGNVSAISGTNATVSLDMGL